MYLSENLEKKWAPVLDHGELGAIADPYKRSVTAIVLENQEQAILKEGAVLNEAGNLTGYTGASTATGPAAGFDPILISLVRRSLPNLMAYDVCGVQPMTGPTGLIFAMRSKYATNTALTPGEALYNEANTNWSGNGSHTAFGTLLGQTATQANTVNPGANAVGGFAAIFGLSNTGVGFPTAIGEDLGGATNLNAMGFSIEKVTVTACTRALKAEYTMELAQDLKAVHGLDAETELSNILSTEILAEINREVIRTIYATAVVGATTANIAGVFNLSTTSGDTDGRWQVEKYKGLIYQIERECNKIAKDTRRGKGNIIICSTDVASALAMSGLLDYSSNLKDGMGTLTVDDTGSTYCGTLFGRIKVYADPYSLVSSSSAISNDYAVVGYKGSIAYDAGLFYCPYVPLQMVRAIDPNTFQPKIGFKTRYGMVANPFAEGAIAPATPGRLANNTNLYYRKFMITSLK
jgi:hypothetical protein